MKKEDIEKDGQCAIGAQDDPVLPGTVQDLWPVPGADLLCWKIPGFFGETIKLQGKAGTNIGPCVPTPSRYGILTDVLKSTLILAIYANTREIPRFADFIEFHEHHTNFRKFSETIDGIAKK